MAKLNGILSSDQVDSLGEAENAINSMSMAWSAFTNSLVADTLGKESAIGGSLALFVATLQAASFAIMQLSIAVITFGETTIRSLKPYLDPLQLVVPKLREINTQEMHDSPSHKQQELTSKSKDVIERQGNGSLRPQVSSKPERNSGEQVEQQETANELLKWQTMLRCELRLQLGHELAHAIGHFICSEVDSLVVLLHRTPATFS